MELLVLEDEVCDDGKHHQRDTLLDDLQLHEIKGTAVASKTQTVGWYLTTVLEERNHPRKGDYKVERPVCGDARLLESQMTIPGKSHEHVAQNEQKNRIKSVYHCHNDLLLQSYEEATK